MSKGKAQRSDKSSPPTITIRPFMRFLPDPTREDLADETQNHFFFEALIAGRSSIDRPWLQLPLALFKAASEEQKSSPGRQSQKECARILVKLGYQVSLWVALLEGSNPKMMAEIARNQATWPVIGSVIRGWETDAVERLANLGLGQGRKDVIIPWRKAQGDETKLPARRWAIAAIRCVNGTRFLQQGLPLLVKQERENLRQGKLKIEVAPAWAANVKNLEDYSDRTRPEWGRFIRGVIRQQESDFEERPEWENQREACKALRKGTPSDFQNAILDDIAAALKTITVKEANEASLPLPDLPKFGGKTKG